MLADFLDDLGRSSDLVRLELGRGDFLRASSYGFDGLSAAEQSAFLRQALGGATPSKLHAAIMATAARSFVTTNFDDLIELSAPGNLKVVLGSQRVEVAEIVAAKSSGFLFKIHGDVGDIASIVFTREQYREMLDSRRNVVQALKTLLMSRPIIYVGFGLRDPDFVQIIDALGVDFSTTVRDHFAIVSDVLEQEIDFWRRNTGIELVPYRTSGGPERHIELYTTIEELASAPSAPPDAGSARQLALVRYLSRLVSLNAYPADIYKLNYRVEKPPGEPSYGRDLLGYLEVAQDLLITGPPGSGKSTAMRAAINKIASKSLTELLAGSTGDAVRVPVLVSLRDYDGDLPGLIDRSLPDGLTLSLLQRETKLYLALDGLNEVATQFVDDDRLRTQIEQVIQQTPGAAHILSTRFPDGWAGFSLPVLQVGELGQGQLDEALTAIGADVNQLDPGVLELLKRPLFLGLIASGQIDPSKVSGPHSIYRELLEGWDIRLRRDGFTSISLVEALSEVAYSAISRGEQFFSVQDFLHGVQGSGGEREGRALLDALIDRSILVAGPNGQLGFFHHSIAEYFAAGSLAQRLKEEGLAVLSEVLQLKTWDHTLLLTLGSLDTTTAELVLMRVIEADLALALRSLWYIEADQAKWVALVLDRLGVSSDLDHVQLLVPHPELVIAQLERIVGLGDTMGADAAGALMLLQPREEMGPFLAKLMVANQEDFNFCNGLARRLAGRLDPDVVFEALEILGPVVGEKQSVELLDVERSDQSDLQNFTSAFGVLLGAKITPLQVVDRLGQGFFSRAVAIEVAQDRGTTDDVIYLIEQAEDASIAEFWLGLNLKYENHWGSARLMPRLETLCISLATQLTGDGRALRWRIEFLGLVAKRSERLRAELERRLFESEGAIGVALAHVLGQEDSVVARLKALLNDPLPEEEYDVLGVLDEFNWSDHPDLVEAALTSDNVELRRELVDVLRLLEIDGPAWTQEFDAHVVAKVFNVLAIEDPWHRDVLGEVVAGRGGPASRQEIFEAFRKEDETKRRLVASVVLDQFVGMTLTEIPEDIVDWLIENVPDRVKDRWHMSLLASIATDEFVRQRIAPAWKRARGNTRKRYGALLKRCGDELQRRYIADDGRSLLF